MLKRFLHNAQGSVLILFGIGVVMLIGIGGASIDLGVQQLMRVKLQRSADAAATSAASLRMANGQVTIPMREVAAQRYFNLNYPENFYGIPRPAPGITVTSNTVIVTGAGVVPTTFVSNFGIAQLEANALSQVSISEPLLSDFDVVIVVDESGSEKICAPPLPATGDCGASVGYVGSRMEQMQIALRMMVDKFQPPGAAPNPNVRMGVVGYSRMITSKWGLSSNRAEILQAIDGLKPRGGNYEHVGLMAARNMVLGGTPGIGNATDLGNYLNNSAQPTTPGAVQTTPGLVRDPMDTVQVPAPRTARTNPSDANGLSPLKYVIFISDGGIMWEPNATYAYTWTNAAGTNYYNPWGNYDPTVAATCPDMPPPNTQNAYCYPAMLNACTAVKNAAGPDSVHLYTAAFVQSPGSLAYATTVMEECASVNPVTGQRDYMFAPTPTDFANWIDTISAEIQAVRIQQ